MCIRDRSSEAQPSRLTELQKEYPGLSRGPAGKSYAFVGDIGRGRTVRSLANVLSQYDNVTMFFVSPPHDALRLDDSLRKFLKGRGVTVEEFDSLDAQYKGKSILSQIDCLYMTRIQREHNSEKAESEMNELDLEPFQLTMPRVSQLKSFTPILHPFPRDSVVNELPIEVDADPRAMYFRQARNGMWARAALLVHLFDAADSLFLAYTEVMKRA